MSDRPDAVRLPPEAERALREVHDPCSVAAGVPIDIVEMGLVRDYERRGSEITLTLCLTSITCTMAGHIIGATREQLLGLEGISDVVVDIDHTVTWTERELGPDASARLARQRERMRGRTRPQQWREAAGAGTAVGVEARREGRRR